MKKRQVILLALVLFSVIVIFSFPAVLSSTIGTLALTVLGDVTRGIEIDSPLNTTYTFNSIGLYTLNLNVSANFTVDTWRYTHEDATHGNIISSSVAFSPNTTFNAVPKSNRITVYANASDGVTVNRSVVFYVQVPNSAPILNAVSNPLYVCESSSMFYNINATDVDEDNLFFDISPKDPFYVRSLSKHNLSLSRANIFSAALDVSQVGNYPITISASDAEYVDTQTLNITVIEINDAPNLPNIGVQTIYARGVGSTLYLTSDVIDQESGNRTDGNLIFNSTILDGPNLFNISNIGVINFTPSSYSSAVYNIEVCVRDEGLSSIHPNISVCGQNGGPRSVCDNFELTITNENRAPTIVTYTPGLVLNKRADEDFMLRVNNYDPDGTTPDTYWYVDGSLVEYDSGNMNNTFPYNFGCGASGTHLIRALVTDGDLNDTLTWTVSLEEVSCPVASSSGGGGGGGGSGKLCNPDWACKSWDVCENIENSLDLGIISGADYRIITDRCELLGLEGERCGYQIRSCKDINGCNVTTGRPSMLQECVFTENPSCSDGIKNCHGGDCELLIDCGGPCQACATCSDGIKNRGESGVDCGGPCPSICTLQGSKAFLISDYTFLIWILLVLFILILIYKLVRIVYIKRRLKE